MLLRTEINVIYKLSARCFNITIFKAYIKFYAYSCIYASKNLKNLLVKSENKIFDYCFFFTMELTNLNKLSFPCCKVFRNKATFVFV